MYVLFVSLLELFFFSDAAVVTIVGSLGERTAAE